MNIQPKIIWGLGFGLGLLTIGCSGLHESQARSTPSVSNIYLAGPSLPAHIRRVLVLPLAADPALSVGPESRQALEPVLHAELARLKRFELVGVSAEKLNQLTGQSFWRAEEKLPPEFFAILYREFDCDAVLFSRVTHFQPYPPLSIGWHFKLASFSDRKICWAADELFDAAEASTAEAFRAYDKGRRQAASGHKPSPINRLWSSMPWQSRGSEGVLSSPRQFGHFTVAAVFSTLPAPENKTKESPRNADH